MKYYIKDDTVYIKYISAIDGKLKTLEFNVNDDKEFLKNLFKEKKEETQIFMLDDTLREKEHPTDEDMEYTTILTLKKPDKENDKQLNYAFYRSKVEEQERIIKDISDKLKGHLTDDDKKKLQTELSNAEKRKEYYENEMKKSVKTSDDIIKKPKSEEILALEKLLKGNLKDANQEAKDMIINILRGKGLSEAQIKDLMDTSKDFKEVLSKITLTPEEKTKIVDDILKMTQDYEDMSYKMARISSFKIPKLKNITLDDINNLKFYYEHLTDLVSKSASDEDIVYYSLNKETPTIGAKYYVYDTVDNHYKTLNVNGKKDYYDLIKSIYLTYITDGKKPFRKSDEYISVKIMKIILNNLKDFIDYHEKRLTGGMGLKDKIKSSITSDVDKKLDILIKQFETLKNDYINFKESMKESKEEPKKEIEIIKNETIKDEPKKEEQKNENNLLDMIKNFSKNKLRHQEIIKQEPIEEKNELVETFERRRRDMEKSDDEEEDDDLDWLD